MVNYSPNPLDVTFAALSDATRRGILARLARGETSVSDLAAPYQMSLPAVSKHLSVLESAGLIARHKDGRVHRCRLTPAPMKSAAKWIEHYKQFWEQQFDALAAYLEKQNEKEKEQWQAPQQVPKEPSRSGGCSRRRAKRSTPRGPNAGT
jgi:DNA-binding transcriptional ArsR family regulator